MKHIRITILFLIALTTLGCGKPSQNDSRLYGFWVSAKEMTLNKINAKTFPKDKLEYLNKNLGELQFEFKENKSAVYLTSQPDFKPEFEEYKITSLDNNSVSIKTIREVEATYYFTKNCFYIINESWGYREYFCKKENHNN